MIRPPFSSNWVTRIIIAMTLFWFSLPVLLTRFELTDREDVYRIADRGTNSGFLRRQVFVEKSDIDILFIGSSYICAGIDPQVVQQELSRRLGRKAVVFTLSFTWPGADRVYRLLQDLLDHRRVGLVVSSFSEILAAEDGPHPLTHRWHLFGEAFPGLDFRYQFVLYANTVLGAPRHLLSALRPNRVKAVSSDPLDETLGSYRSRLNYDGQPATDTVPGGPVFPPEQVIYSPAIAGNFKFEKNGLSPYQLYFIKRISQLTAVRGSRLALLHVPTFSMRNNQKVEEALYWPEVLSKNVAFLGAAPATLFAGAGEVMLRELYYNEHFNWNGSRFFTRAITPALLEIYETTTQTP